MEQPVLTLYELNSFVRGVLSETFNQPFWIRAETSDVRVNQNGHCYLEFIEKDSNNRNVVAKARGSIWANVFRMLKAYFESETGQTFASGLKVLVQVSVEFHEVYGYSLNVHNIDPFYTLGDQARNRAAILKQLEEEGVLTLNKELELPVVTNRIAVISSPTAAGYEDFSNQLENNQDGFAFYTRLFPAIMQGEKTESSIISALDRIYACYEKFDVVVIIRGGGATSELSSFDSYLLAANCAQFPLPVITGIGHERDDTVVDMVAHTRAKTPTAVAEFLIKRMQYTAAELWELQDSISEKAVDILRNEKVALDNLFSRFSYLTKDRTKDQLSILNGYIDRLKYSFKERLIHENVSLNALTQQFSFSISQYLQEQKNLLSNKEQYIELISPENILKKGYTLTLKDNKIVKSVDEIHSGESLVTRFYDGDINVKAE